MTTVPTGAHRYPPVPTGTYHSTILHMIFLLTTRREISWSFLTKSWGLEKNIELWCLLTQYFFSILNSWSNSSYFWNWKGFSIQLFHDFFPSVLTADAMLIKICAMRMQTFVSVVEISTSFLFHLMMMSEERIWRYSSYCTFSRHDRMELWKFFQNTSNTTEIILSNIDLYAFKDPLSGIFDVQGWVDAIHGFVYKLQDKSAEKLIPKFATSHYLIILNSWKKGFFKSYVKLWNVNP